MQAFTQQEGLNMGRTITQRNKKKPAKARRRRTMRRGRRYDLNESEMEENFYMYSYEDLPEIESDLLENDVKPEIHRDYYL